MKTELNGIQKAAILLLSLGEEQAAEMLRRLPPRAVVYIDREVDAMREIAEETREQVLAEFCDAASHAHANGGRLADVLNRAEANHVPETPEVRRIQHIFEDLLLLEDPCVRLVLREVDDETLSMALRTACEAMRRKVLRNVSEKQERVIRDKMHFMEPMRVSEVEAAQERIADAMRRLTESGAIGLRAPCAKEAI